ncbi:uncharacterized protein LOC5569827 isoform X1 [Aedes aegypti]|uniref:Gustatory receptor n=1 Tax=Aedes aegypti TaxID=7159 RepID=A0A1S4FI02_AEDAE|nr:gustatory receptor 77 [Aedes aegypti]NP_001345891.1 gustatory receptor 77 [Aedes aegypti]XP_001658734.3 uncharacterized protein LOC5569827 isoform X1 [Aedes aegypti]XP_021708211.1 uncharacterized protein LOC5569827 isoform X1 [Aedes aegypti]
MSFMLKYWFNIENIYQTIQPACRCMKWFGFMPFTLSASEPGKINDSTTQLPPLTLTRKKLDILLLVLWQVYIISMYNTHWFSSLFNAPMSKIMIFLSVLMYVLEGILTSWVQLRTAFSRVKIDELLRLVRFFDELIESLGLAVNHRRHHLGLVLLIFGTIIGIIFVTAIELALAMLFHEKISPVWEQFFTTGATIYYYLLRTAQVSSLVMFLAAMLAFRARFRLLNEAFRKHFLQKESSFNVDDTQETLRTIAIGHDALTEAIDLFNDVCCLQMVYACASYVMFSIFSMFCIGALVSYQSTDVLFLSLFYTIAFLQYSLHIIPIIKISTDIRNEGKHIAVLVHKAINQSPLSVGSINRLMLFSKQLQQQTPAVSSGMFSFDWTLCFSILSTVATYTMIMVQFELEVPKFFLDALVSSSIEENAALNGTLLL